MAPPSSVAIGPAAPAGPIARMSWADAAERDAAHALDAIAGRLRAGTLRLPVPVDPRHPPAILAAVLAAIHAEAGAGTASGTFGGMA